MRVPLRRRAIAALAASAVATPLLLAAAPAEHQRRQADQFADRLVRASSARSAYRHLQKFQQIADANGGNRAAGTSGHEASTEYVNALLQKAGYDVSYQNFEIWQAKTLTENLSVVSPQPRELKVSAFTFSPSTPAGGIDAPVAVARGDKAPGCSPGDYTAGAFAGRITLVRRGGCTFAEKQAAAAQAGAVGAVVYDDEGRDAALHGTFGSPAEGRIPTAGISKADGEALAAAARDGVTVHLDIRQEHSRKQTRNVIAETRGGSAEHVVALGSHLDSVPEGPGINDNGSGSAGLLEVALKLAREIRKPGHQPVNKVRFAWWSGEELGLLGSDYYVSHLDAQQRRRIALYLNFDMIASPNPAEFVYDGDDSDHKGSGPGPKGSAQIEQLINGYLDRRHQPHEGTDFDGRSDYGPFIEAGIPAGGTFTGAEGIKTEEQAQRYGGTAGTAYDPNYHAAGDTLRNLDLKAFDTNIGVIAHAVGTYAHDLSSLDEPVRHRPAR
ncbi:M28 family metallopeptidase [Streptomyces morookaense]|uniref:M28 family metallopeptidase n=1 Tax=Streptomyces morookaense TaxID=1970 RepID=UPI0033F365BA